MRIRPLRVAALAALGLAMGACADEQQAPLEIKNVQATGSVGGLLLDAVTREPVKDADVVLVAGGAPLTSRTGSTGAFTFGAVPAGEVALTVSAEGYLSAVLHGTLVGEAGEFPVDNGALTLGPIGLVPSSGSLSVMLIKDDGSPAPGLTLTARANRRFFDYAAQTAGSGFGDAQVTAVGATSDAMGMVTFNNLPDYVLLGPSAAGDDVVTVIVPPVLSAAGGPAMYDYPGGTFAFHMTALGASTPIIVLHQPTPATLAVLASNIRTLVGGASGVAPAVIAKTGPVWVTFNQPLSSSATEVTLLDEKGLVPSVQASLSVSYNTLQLTFSPSLDDAQEFNFVIHAVAAVGDRTLRGDFAGAFFTAPPETVARPVLTRDTVNPSVIYVEFSEPVGTGSAGTNTLDMGNCILFFGCDIDGSLNTLDHPDYPGEIRYPTCLPSVGFVALEPAVGLAGQSGYTRTWTFTPPLVGPPLSQVSMTPATPVHLLFSHVASPSYVMKRVTGSPVPDFTGVDALSLP
jgi:hypothetical protein